MRNRSLSAAGFTFAEILMVVVILGLLAGVGVLKLNSVYRDGVADRARVDIDLLNKAVRDWRADNPSMDFATAAGGSAATAWSKVSPYMPLTSGVTELKDFNAATAKHWIYAYHGTYDATVTAVTAIRADCSSGYGTVFSQPILSLAGWPSSTGAVCVLTPLAAAEANYVFYAVAAN